MTAEENNPQNSRQKADVDMELTSQGMKRLFDETKRRGYGKLDINEKEMDFSSHLGREFVDFVRKSISGIGISEDEAEKKITLEMDSDNPNLDKILKEMWNKRAKGWAWVESSANYQITFSTLISFFETSPKKKKERIVSLGSGPGMYESFLIYLYSKLKMPSKVEMYCVDFSGEMTAVNRKILNNFRGDDGRMIANVKPITGDMTKLDFPDKFFDQIICNNSLQWAPEWRKAVSEMSRVINPEGLGVLYMFINRHPMKLKNELTKETLVSIGDIQPTELLDTLEQNRFQVEHTRQFKTTAGMGQLGGTSDRMFIKARYKKDGLIRSWRNADVEAAMHYYVAQKK